MTKDPSDFWAAIGVGVNVVLGMVAFFAFKASRDSAEASRDSANYARQQAESAETQTRIVTEAAEREREKIEQDRESSRRLLWPAIYASLLYDQDGYSLLLVNGSHYPVIFTGIYYNEFDPILSSDPTSVGELDNSQIKQVVKSGEAIRLMVGSYEKWDAALHQFYDPERPSGFIAYDPSTGMTEYRNIHGELLEPDKYLLLGGGFRLSLPFAYISPEAKTYDLQVNFHSNFGMIRFMGSCAVQTRDKTVFTEVLRPATAEDVARFSPPQP